MKTENLFMKGKSIFLLCFLLLASVSSFAQQTTITGKILDDSGQPLPGVTIMKDGTTEGVITDINGVYTLTNVSPETTIVISFIGMETQRIVVGNQTTIDVNLQSDTADLEEVVVVGFGTQKKATLTGAVTQVKGDDVMQSKGTSSAAAALQGEVAGLTVTRSSSRPGNDDVDLNIRGDVSINSGSPLILLDGLEIDTEQFSTLNQNDIETVSVIKDGSAAIFGTKAANGVILVTSKKGKKGKTKVDYVGDFQINFTRDLPICDMYELAELGLMAGDNDKISYIDADGNEQITGYAKINGMTREELEMIDNGTFPMMEPYLWNGAYHRFQNLNMIEEVYGTTFSHRHSVSVSGGGEKATYRTSLGYSDERSPLEFVYDGAKRYNFRTNVNYDITDVIKTNFTVSYDYRTIDEPNQGIGLGIQNPTYFPVYNDDGQYYGLWGHNIPALLDEGGRTVTNYGVMRLGGTITADLNKYVTGLSFTYTPNMYIRNYDKTARKLTTTLYDWDGNITNQTPSPEKNSVQNNLQKTFFQNHVVQGLYKRSFGDHNFGAMLGMTSELKQYNAWELYRANLSSPELDDINTGDVTTQTTEGGSHAESLVSYISRLNYDYKGIYMAEFMARYDGSSRLDPDYRWKPFFGGSAGVRLSEMDFLKDGPFQNLKLRASYGQTASTGIIGRYDYISSISTGSFAMGTNPALVNTAWVNGMTTTDRTWEYIGMTNFAVDFATLNNRLSGTFEYYIANNNDMIVEVEYPSILGDDAPATNDGAFKTKGWEATLGWRDQVGEFKYNASVSVWDSRSEITEMAGANIPVQGVNKYIEGSPVNSIWAYETDGLFQTEQQVLDYYNQYGFVDPSNQLELQSGSLLPAYRSKDRLTPGCVIRNDVDGDGNITVEDLVRIGDNAAHYSFGINLGAAYKGFDFSMLLQGVMQHHLVRTGSLGFPYRAAWMNQNNSWVNNDLLWTPDNTDATYPLASYKTGRVNWNYGHLNDINVINARYLRGKMISLGYTVPNRVVEKAGLGHLRFSVTGNDLFVLSNIKDGLDPEDTSGGHNGDMLPFSTTLIFGVQVGF